MQSKKPTVWVIGDAILDLSRSVVYQRPSPEDLRCPVATDEKTIFDLGGAANVARWIAGLGEVEKVTLHCHFSRGWDFYSKVFYGYLRAARVELGQFLLRDHGRGTLKERIYLKSDVTPEASYQVIRIDRDTDIAISAREAADLCQKMAFANGVQMPAAIVVADYGKGVFTGDAGKALIERLSAFCRERKIVTLVNSKTPERWRDFEADFLICNERESVSIGAMHPGLILSSRHLVVTRAEHGVRAFVLGGAAWAVSQVTAAAPCAQAVDVTGAGDAFLAGLASHLVATGFRSGTVLGDDRLAWALAAAQNASATCVQQMGCGEPRSR